MPCSGIVMGGNAVALIGWPLTDHGEHVRVVDGAVVLVSVLEAGPVKNPGDRQAKVGSEGVDDHGGPYVVGLRVRRVRQSKA